MTGFATVWRGLADAPPAEVLDPGVSVLVAHEWRIDFGHFNVVDRRWTWANEFEGEAGSIPPAVFTLIAFPKLPSPTP
jgi:hypothetical protein